MIKFRVKFTFKSKLSEAIKDVALRKSSHFLINTSLGQVTASEEIKGEKCSFSTEHEQMVPSG